MDMHDAKVAQVLIPVDNLDRAVVFYQDVLGLKFLFKAPPQMAFFQSGDVRLLIGETPAGRPVQRGSAVYFQVEDIQGVFQTLSGRGVVFQAVPHVVHRTPEIQLWLAEFQDPDGNPLALMAQTPNQG